MTPTPALRGAQIALTKGLVFISCFQLVTDAGLPKAVALIVFRTTYLSYECFIEETKYELVGLEAPQEHEGMANSCTKSLKRYNREKG